MMSIIALATRCAARLRPDAPSAAASARRLAFAQEHYLSPVLSRENDSPSVVGGTTTGLIRNPRTSAPVVRLHAIGDPLISISSLLDVQDIVQVDMLTDYVRLHHPGQCSRSRSFDASPVDYLDGEAVFPDDDVADSHGGGAAKRKAAGAGGGGGGGGGDPYGGGNDVVFLEGILQSTMPNLVRHLLRSVGDATDAAGWSPHPRQLGVRCVESLLYRPHGELRLHTDGESVYTVVVMLSDPDGGGGGEGGGGGGGGGGDDDDVVAGVGGDEDRFAGGDFVIERRRRRPRRADADGDDAAGGDPEPAPGRLLRASPRRGDAIVFDSNAYHGVDTILSGRRRVLVLELWPFDDTTEGDRRPSRDSYLHRRKLPEIHIPGASGLVGGVSYGLEVGDS